MVCLLAARYDWIIKHAVRLCAEREALTQQVYFYGEAYSLQLEPNAAPGVHWQDGVCLVGGVPDLICARHWLDAWFYAQALPVFQTRLARFSAHWRVSPNTLKLSRATRRWGSCNARGDIRLNWRLLQTPLLAIDSVLAHELAHRIEMNHSPRFWREVSRLMPEWQTGHAWLKTHAALCGGAA